MLIEEKIIETELEEKLELLSNWAEFYAEMLLVDNRCKIMSDRIFAIIEKGKELKLVNILKEIFLKTVEAKITVIIEEGRKIKKKPILELYRYRSKEDRMMKKHKTSYTMLELILKRIKNWEKNNNEISDLDIKKKIKNINELFKLEELEEIYFDNQKHDLKIYITTEDLVNIIKRLKNLKKLSIGYHKDELYLDLKELTELKELNVSTSYKIKNLDSLHNLEKLKIDIYKKDIPIIFDWSIISKLSKLKELIIFNARNISFSKDIINLTNLEYLEIQSSKIIEISDEICKLSNLNKLILYDIECNNIPIFITKMINLKKLILWSKKSFMFPPEIVKLEKLEFLKVENIEDCKNIEKLRNLRTLKIDKCIKKEFSEELGELKSLIKLEVVLNTPEIPEFICKLENLRELKIGTNFWGKSILFPESMIKLQKLEELNLNGVNVHEFPLVITKLSNLKILKIANNGSELTLPKEIGELKRLEELAIHYFKLSEIPIEIGLLKNLRKLVLNKNEIEKLPKEIENLQKLEILNLAENKISVIPEFIGKLQKLEILNVTGNKISVIPEFIGKLANLEELNIIHINEIKIIIPNSIINLRKLKKFDVIFSEADVKILKKLMLNSLNDEIMVHSVILTKTIVKNYEITKKYFTSRGANKYDSKEIYKLKFENYLNYYRN